MYANFVLNGMALRVALTIVEIVELAAIVKAVFF
jgi:hypothetical protein